MDYKTIFFVFNLVMSKSDKFFHRKENLINIKLREKKLKFFKKKICGMKTYCPKHAIVLVLNKYINIWNIYHLGNGVKNSKLGEGILALQNYWFNMGKGRITNIGRIYIYHFIYLWVYHGKRLTRLTFFNKFGNFSIMREDKCLSWHSKKKKTL